ncbi:MAG: hypothetical protein ACFFAL_09020 [Promethearchaeota archaeon]
MIDSDDDFDEEEMKAWEATEPSTLRRRVIGCCAIFMIIILVIFLLLGGANWFIPYIPSPP